MRDPMKITKFTNAFQGLAGWPHSVYAGHFLREVVGTALSNTKICFILAFVSGLSERTLLGQAFWVDRDSYRDANSINTAKS